MAGMYEEWKALDILMRDGEQSARALREKINSDLVHESPRYVQLAMRFKCGCLFNVRMGAAEFYAMMVRLEEAGEVEGWNKEQELDEYSLRERWYRIREGCQRLDSLPISTGEFELGSGYA